MKRTSLDDLFDAARREPAPAVDVADAVLTALASRRLPVRAVLNRSLLWTSVASSAVAAAALLAAFVAWQHSGDSANEILKAVAWVAQ